MKIFSALEHAFHPWKHALVGNWRTYLWPPFYVTSYPRRGGSLFQPLQVFGVLHSWASGDHLKRTSGASPDGNQAQIVQLLGVVLSSQSA
jgi:hypothetical protein